MTTIKQHLETCIEALKRGELTEQDLRQAIEIAEQTERTARKRQDLLYLQASHTGLNAPVNGMAILTDGQLSDGPANPDAWPYHTVLDAIRDGWRVLQFPNQALMMDESRTYGLGCEFILEK